MKIILRKENWLQAIGERLENGEDKKWEQMGENAISNLHLAVIDNILSNILELLSTKKNLGYFENLYEAKSLHNKIF